MSERSARPSSGPIMENPDVVLIGAGVMSASLGVALRVLNPEIKIQIVEALPRVALESSHAWNNAGTGHAALCELNYTPRGEDGSIAIDKAIKINEQFETSKHFWAYLVQNGILTNPEDFIRRVPHMSFVWGEENQQFLKDRHAALVKSHLFDEMEYSEDPDEIEKWAPLLLQGRDRSEPIAATRVEAGTDINFGALTKQMIDYLVAQDGVEIAMETSVRDIDLSKKGDWKVKVKSKDEGKKKIRSPFVFIGAGGGSLPLLQKSGIPEGKGFGGFPVSGQFLVCKDKDVVERHAAKVYGKAAVGAPPMSVPHLDTRVIDGEKSLLFGPYAGFSPKFLKEGSQLDLIKSVKLNNLLPMLAVGKDNIPLTQYLIEECLKSHESRCESLREFFPDAKLENWELATAGQRVQIIKQCDEKTGTLQFGTELVSAADGSLAAVLGASPGASIAVSIILDVLETCFGDQMESSLWKEKLAELVPAHGRSLDQDEQSYETLRETSDKLLGLA